LNRIAAASGFRSPHRANAVRRQLAIEGARERKRGVFMCNSGRRQERV
jgi:hypothetical protein